MSATKRLLASIAIALTACTVQEHGSVSVEGRPVSSSATECKYAPGADFQLGEGVLDVGTEYSSYLAYALPLVVRNDLKQPTADGQSKAGSDFTIENVRVRVNPSGYVAQYHPNPPLLDFAAVGGTPARTSVPHSGPPITGDGGEAATVIDAIPPDLGFVIQSAATAAGPGVHRIVLGISIEGRTNDGREIAVDEYFYPIKVCQGCLPRPTCAAPAVETFGCGYPGQDTAPFCAAPTTTAP